MPYFDLTAAAVAKFLNDVHNYAASLHDYEVLFQPEQCILYTDVLLSTA